MVKTSLTYSLMTSRNLGLVFFCARIEMLEQSFARCQHIPSGHKTDEAARDASNIPS